VMVGDIVVVVDVYNGMVVMVVVGM
jgi:hypothetical protein